MIVKPKIVSLPLLKKLFVKKSNLEEKVGYNYDYINYKKFRRTKVKWPGKIIRFQLKKRLSKFYIRWLKKFRRKFIFTKKFKKFVHMNCKIYFLAYFKMYGNHFKLPKNRRLSLKWLLTLSSFLSYRNYKNTPRARLMKKKNSLYARGLVQRILTLDVATEEDRLLKWLFLFQARKIFKHTDFSSLYLYFFRYLLFFFTNKRAYKEEINTQQKDIICNILNIPPVNYWLLYMKSKLKLNKGQKPSVFFQRQDVKILYLKKKINNYLLLNNKRNINIIDRTKTLLKTKNVNALNFIKKTLFKNRLKYSLLVYLLPFWCGYYYEKYFISSLRFVKDYWLSKFYSYTKTYNFIYSIPVITYARSFFSFYSKKFINLKLKGFYGWVKSKVLVRPYKKLKKLWKPYKKFIWYSTKSEWRSRKKLFFPLVFKKFFKMSIFRSLFEKKKVVTFSNYNLYRPNFKFETDYERPFIPWVLRKYNFLRRNTKEMKFLKVKKNPKK